jgi:hypothetical protein
MTSKGRRFCAAVLATEDRSARHLDPLGPSRAAARVEASDTVWRCGAPSDRLSALPTPAPDHWRCPRRAHRGHAGTLEPICQRRAEENMIEARPPHHAPSDSSYSPRRCTSARSDAASGPHRPIPGREFDRRQRGSSAGPAHPCPRTSWDKCLASWARRLRARSRL